MAAKLRERGIPADRIHVIPNWCDDETIRPASETENPLRRAWGLEGKFVVGYSGNLGRAHEFETILDAARRLWDETRIIFVVIGGGHMIEEFSRQAKQLHLDRHFRFLPYQDQATLLSRGAEPALDIAQARTRRAHRSEQVLQHCRGGPAHGRHRRQGWGARISGRAAQVRICHRARRFRCPRGAAHAART